jgi:Creatinine amidohydrolase
MERSATGILFLGIMVTIAPAQSPVPVSVAPEPEPAISAQTMLSVKWEELTTEDFLKALILAKNTCVLPLGVVEKHGPTGPLGTDCSTSAMLL